MNGAELRYQKRRGDVLGWSTMLRDACPAVHNAFVSAHRHAGGSAGDWGKGTGNGNGSRL